MKNCLIAQSGGPTAVINASVVGLVEKNQELRVFDKVYAGLNGIEGILKEDLLVLSDLPAEDLALLSSTPSAGLGSCRYKLRDVAESREEYVRIFELFEKHDIGAFFYVGGNDSQDTVKKLARYAREADIPVQVLGIPKTIDNDLMVIDHTPGFGSAARYIATAVLESYLDSMVYTHNGIFITETMGRDTGWLAASSMLARYNGRPCADFILLPEVPFYKEAFLKQVAKRYEEKGHVYIVVSEGVKDEAGDFLAATKAQGHDRFGHAQLGGAGNALKELIVDQGITKRVKVLELSVLQRSAFHQVSPVDHAEARALGANALLLAQAGETEKVSILTRVSDKPYAVTYGSCAPDRIANRVKYFPEAWIDKNGFGVTEEALDYFWPLTGPLPQYRILHHFHEK